MDLNEHSLSQTTGAFFFIKQNSAEMRSQTNYISLRLRVIMSGILLSRNTSVCALKYEYSLHCTPRLDQRALWC